LVRIKPSSGAKRIVFSESGGTTEVVPSRLGGIEGVRVPVRAARGLAQGNSNSRLRCARGQRAPANDRQRFPYTVSRMKSVIIGTAGHVDHGKTALVKALTGIDADRLDEEKRRGITIDIGFAHLELAASHGEKLRLGFVDVPGHERFVRNMLAGVGGIDVVLLVIAADESIKPQTREHFDICRLLSVRRGITVLTKSDAVDAETLDVVRLEVEEFLRGSFLDPNRAESADGDVPGRAAVQSRAPIIAVSSLTGAGLPELKKALAQVAAEVPAKDSTALARLPIDRVFTMKGFGTVVTGTLVSGTIRKEDELEVFPTGKRVRVRAAQVHGQAAEKAVAGQRTALNLAGVTVDQLSRGMMLAPPETFRRTGRVDTLLSLLPSAKLLNNGARVHFHAYTMETVAEARLFDAKQLKPGDEQYVQLRLAEPSLLLPGDRFILRQFSPVVTIGGGIVLDASPLTRRRPPPVTLAFLAQLTSGSLEDVLTARVTRRDLSGLRVQDVPAEMNIRLEETSRLVTCAPLVRCGGVLISRMAFVKAQAQLRETVTRFHDINALVRGINQEQLREQMNLGSEVFEHALRKMIEEKNLQMTGDLVHLPGRGVVMKDDEAESKRVIEQAFSSAGLQVPALYNVLAGLKVDKTRAQKIVTLLLRDKVLIKISEELVFHQSAIAELRKQLATYKAKATVAGVAKIDVGNFKQLTGVSRKYAIPLLEYLDRERVTRRVGDERVIL
jgi:selenocysteine-specific elongation factor